MNVLAALQNIRTQHPVAFRFLYLTAALAVLVVVAHAIAFGAELLVPGTDQPVVKWETTIENADGVHELSYNSPSLYQGFKVTVKDAGIVGADSGDHSTLGTTVSAEQLNFEEGFAVYRIDLKLLGRPSRICFLECDMRGNALHVAEVQMRPSAELAARLESLQANQPAFESQQ